MKETLARKPYDSDWRGAGSVDYLALETSIKPGLNIGTRHWLEPPWTIDLSAF